MDARLERLERERRWWSVWFWSLAACMSGAIFLLVVIAVSMLRVVS